MDKETMEFVVGIVDVGSWVTYCIDGFYQDLGILFYLSTKAWTFYACKFNTFKTNDWKQSSIIGGANY